MSSVAFNAPASWLWHRPERAVTWAFILGTVAAAASLGAFAMVEEKSNSFVGSPEWAHKLLLAHVGALLLEAIVWGAVIRLALSLALGWRGIALLLGASCVVATLLSMFAAVASGISEGRSSLSPTGGILFTFVLDAALLLSFVPILRLARHVIRGGSEVRALDVAATGFAWTSVVATVGVVLVPAPYFRIPCVLALAAGLFGLCRATMLARAEDVDEDAASRQARFRKSLRRNVTTGVARVGLAALVLIPLRLHEQSITRSPALIAIYDRVTSLCDVVPAGREGDVSLWLVDCGSVTGPTVGWDERAGVLLQDEKLFERVPRLRSVPPYSTSKPR